MATNSSIPSTTKNFSYPIGQFNPGFRSWLDPIGGHKYVYIPGPFNNQGEAWAAAENYRGYPVVFNTMGEWQRVMQAFNYKTIAYAHTGHFQSPSGAEPGLGWQTYTGEPSAPLHFLFNSDGPDDGVRNKWGFNLTYAARISSNGTVSYYVSGTVFYGPSKGKNEDAGVIWYDNDGRLEDISVNGRGGVLVELNSPRSARASDSFTKLGSTSVSRSQGNSTLVSLDGISPGSIVIGAGDSNPIGSQSADRLVGTHDSGVLVGFGGSDVLMGKGGDDVLWGGAGRDKLSGGTGEDAFIFNTGKPFNQSVATDRIVDFSPNDKIVLDTTTFTKLKGKQPSLEVVQSMTQAQESSALITYNSLTGALYYNQNLAATGFGKGGQFASLQSGLKLTAENLLVQI